MLFTELKAKAAHLLRGESAEQQGTASPQLPD